MTINHEIPDVRLTNQITVQFYPLDSGSTCIVHLDVKPGIEDNTIRLELIHDSHIVKSVLVKLPNYREGDTIQL